MSLSCPAIVSPLLAHVTSSEAGGKSQFSVLSFHRGRAGCNYFLPRTGSAWRTKCPHQNPRDNQAGFPLQNMWHARTGGGAHIITGGQACFHTHAQTNTDAKRAQLFLLVVLSRCDYSQRAADLLINATNSSLFYFFFCNKIIIKQTRCLRGDPRNHMSFGFY